MNEFEKTILQNLKVLYVEDEIITRSKTTNEIKSHIGNLYTAKDCSDGIEKFEKYKPDILVTDLIMPDMTGIELGREIRSRGYDCPIVITTSLNDTKTILESVDIGIEKYIIKPIDSDELLQVLLRIGKKIFKTQIESALFKDVMLLTKNQKRQFEMLIRSEWGNYLKGLTGKGATNIEITINGNLIELKSIDCLTQYEKSLLRKGYSYKMIDFTRTFLYKGVQSEIEEMFSSIGKINVYLKEIEVNSQKNYDKLVFSFVVSEKKA